MKLMMQCQMIGDSKALIPATQADLDTFAKFKVGTWYKTDSRRARNPDHHRKGFAIINLIFENQERYRTLEDLLVELKLKAGWYIEHVRTTGEVVYVPKSISFADMDQTEFEQFYDRVIDIARDDYGLLDALQHEGFLDRPDYQVPKL